MQRFPAPAGSVGLVYDGLQICIRQRVHPLLSNRWQHPHAPPAFYRLPIALAGCQLQTIEPELVNILDPAHLHTDTILKPGISLAVCFPLASAARGAAVKLFAYSILLHGNAPALVFFFPLGRVGSFAHLAAPPSFVHFAPGGALIAARSETISRQNDESTVVALCDSGFILPNSSATSSVYRCPTIGQRPELASL